MILHNEGVRQLIRTKKEIVIILLILFFYFLLRVPNLTAQPIFADEAIYIRWAQVMKSEPTLRFISLTDGKPPLFMWTMIPLFKVFKDPLLAGRILSVLVGSLTVLGGIFLGWKFFSKQVGLWAGILIVITPFMIFFDRMALVDSMLAAFSIWTLTLALLLTKYKRLDLAMFLGYLIGGSLLTKPPGFFNILSLPLSSIPLNWKSANRQNQILRLFGLWLVAIIIGLTIFNILRLGPGFNNLNSRNQDYTFSPSRLLQYPLDPFIPHLKDVFDWMIHLAGLPMILLIIYSVFLIIRKWHPTGLVILLWSLFPLIVQMVFLQVFTARYILFSIPPLLIMAAFGLENIFTKKYFNYVFLRLFLVLIILAWPVYFIYQTLSNAIDTPLSNNEKEGYYQKWTAGFGFKEIAQFLDDESKKGLVVVGTEGSFGTLSDGLQIYLDKNPKVIVIGGKGAISPQLRQSAIDHPTYFVANRLLDQPIGDNVKLIKQYKKPVSKDGSQEVIELYQVFPDKLITSSGILAK